MSFAPSLLLCKGGFPCAHIHERNLLNRRFFVKGVKNIMTEQLLHLRPGKSTMVNMENNQAFLLTRYEVALLAAIVDGVVEVKGERVIYLHQDNTLEQTARAALIDLETDQPDPLNPEDAEKIAKVVRRIKEIEASSYSKNPGENDMIKSQLRRGIEPHVMGKPLWRNLI